MENAKMMKLYGVMNEFSFGGDEGYIFVIC